MQLQKPIIVENTPPNGKRPTRRGVLSSTILIAAAAIVGLPLAIQTSAKIADGNSDKYAPKPDPNLVMIDEVTAYFEPGMTAPNRKAVAKLFGDLVTVNTNNQTTAEDIVNNPALLKNNVDPKKLSEVLQDDDTKPSKGMKYEAFQFFADNYARMMNGQVVNSGTVNKAIEYATQATLVQNKYAPFVKNDVLATFNLTHIRPEINAGMTRHRFFRRPSGVESPKVAG